MLINQPAIRVALQAHWADPERVAKRVRIAPYARPIKCLEHYSPGESISQGVMERAFLLFAIVIQVIGQA